MNPLPRAFRRDAQRIGELADALAAPRPGVDDVPRIRRFHKEVRQFLRRWQSHAHIPEVKAALGRFGENFASMEGNLARFYIVSVLELLEKWRQRFIQECLLRGEVIATSLIRDAPAHLVEPLKKAYTGGDPQSYQPEAEYRENERLADEADAAYRAELAELRTIWPDRVDAAFVARLEKLNTDPSADELSAWEAELHAILDALPPSESA